MTTPKPSEQVRIDALRMAQKKAKSGCAGCAAAYLDVAREHGATDEELTRAIDGAPALSRAALLRASLGAAAALAATALLPQAGAAAHESSADGTPMPSGQVAALAGAVLAEPQGRELAAHIEQRGYHLNVGLSRGATLADGTTVLALVYSAQGTKQFAHLLRIGYKNGQHKLVAEEIGLRPATPQPSRDWTADQAKAWFRTYVTVATLGRFDGSAAITGSAVVTPNDAGGCFSCIAYCLSGSCGSDVMECLFFGPEFWACAIALCGFAMGWCVSLCYSYGGCP